MSAALALTLLALTLALTLLALTLALTLSRTQTRLDDARAETRAAREAVHEANATLDASLFSMEEEVSGASPDPDDERDCARSFPTNPA